MCLSSNRRTRTGAIQSRKRATKIELLPNQLLTTLQKSHRTWITHPFRLHLLCEEGYHETAHEGYLVLKADEFIKKYGVYLKFGIWMLLFGAKVASHGILPSMLLLKFVTSRYSKFRILLLFKLFSDSHSPPPLFFLSSFPLSSLPNLLPCPPYTSLNRFLYIQRTVCRIH